MIKESVSFYNNKNQRLSGRIYKSEPVSETGIIFSHGLFSSKDGYKITRLAEDLVNEGYTLLTFDFSFAGESDGKIEDLSVIQEVNDLCSAFDFFCRYGIKKIHLMGSSMGGAVTLLFASEKKNNISSIITIATPVDFKNLMLKLTRIDDTENLPDNGMTLIDNVLIKNFFFREINQINVKKMLYDLKVPMLVIHGALDAVVDVVNVNKIENYVRGPVKRVIIEDGDHNLTREIDLQVMKDKIIEWLKEN